MQCVDDIAHTQSCGMPKPGAPCRISIADIEADHCASVQEVLDTDNALLCWVRSSEELRQQLSTAPPEVLLLDPEFAEGQALALYCEHAHPPRPWLVVCTHDCSDEMRLACVKAGADHLLYKPVIQAWLPPLIDHLRYRLKDDQQNGSGLDDQWALDSLRWLLYTPQGVQVSLTYREMLIVNSLASSPGRAIPRDVLIQILGFDPVDYDVRRLEILVRRLRTKVAGETDLSLPVTTVHGIGYAFTAPVRLIG